jgi:MFS family permease
MIIEMASSNTLIQTLVSDELRGRVMAVYSMMFMGMAPFGALLAGALAHSLGAPSTVALGGVACIAGALVFTWRLPALRLEARRVIVALEVAGGEPPEEMTGEASALTPRNSENQAIALALPFGGLPPVPQSYGWSPQKRRGCLLPWNCLMTIKLTWISSRT